jgi:hypothetical protein
MVSEPTQLSYIKNFCLGDVTNLGVMFPGTSLWYAYSIFICLPPEYICFQYYISSAVIHVLDADLDIILSNGNEYQEFLLGGKGGWCVGLTTLPHSCADCLEIWGFLLPGTLGACNRPVQRLLYLSDITVSLFLCALAVCRFHVFQKICQNFPLRLSTVIYIRKYLQCLCLRHFATAITDTTKVLNTLLLILLS